MGILGKYYGSIYPDVEEYQIGYNLNEKVINKKTCNSKRFMNTIARKLFNNQKNNTTNSLQS